MSDAVVILGASARAAAFSALRAGLTPWCADCFADEDLAARCVALPAENWPDDLFPLAAGFPPGPWLYTGGLENYPEFVEQLAAGRLLCGNRGAALAAARDPFTVQRVLAAAGLAGPRCERDVERLDPQLRWLCKSRRSAGGLRVRPWPTSDSRHEPDDYFQQFVPGLACAAAYVAAAGDAVFLGMTEQLLWGAPGEARFRYAGSLGPMPLAAACEAQLARLGRVLARSLGLVGVFGVDGVLDDGVFWPVEINPRYTASMEIHERASGRPVVACHLAACVAGELPRIGDAGPNDGRGGGWHGKEVLFARRAIRAGGHWSEWIARQNAGRDWPRVADVPRARTRISAGAPLLTIFSQGACRATAVAGLEQLRRETEAALELPR